MAKVYVPNNSGHDFSDAHRFGELVFVTTGMIERFKVNTMFRQVVDALEESSEEDYIMVTGLTQINVILTSVFTYKHHKLNMLIYDVKEEKYVPRKIVFGNLLDTAKIEEDLEDENTS
jgi:hypothetical protein